MVKLSGRAKGPIGSIGYRRVQEGPGESRRVQKCPRESMRIIEGQEWLPKAQLGSTSEK